LLRYKKSGKKEKKAISKIVYKAFELIEFRTKSKSTLILEKSN
jgi:ribosomal protein S7